MAAILIILLTVIVALPLLKLQGPHGIVQRTTRETVKKYKGDPKDPRGL